MILVNPFVENLWIIKVILRGFELASDLRINFIKSNLVGVNVNLVFMELVGDFLHRKLDALSFRCPSLLVGDQPPP